MYSWKQIGCLLGTLWFAGFGIVCTMPAMAESAPAAPRCEAHAENPVPIAATDGAHLAAPSTAKDRNGPRCCETHVAGVLARRALHPAAPLPSSVAVVHPAQPDNRLAQRFLRHPTRLAHPHPQSIALQSTVRLLI